MTGPSGKRPVSDKEQELWETVTDTVRPLSGKKESDHEKTGPEQENSQSKSGAKSKSGSPPPPKEPSPPPPLPPQRGLGEMAGVDRRTAARLKRGQLAIEGELDLHGFKQPQARRALDDFIEKAAHDGRRCLLVVTGKGERAGVEEGWRGSGVLREAVPGWLNDPVNRDHVLAFCHAQPRHGGDGALYILLKRKR
ncbi:MAG: Smr/MutS family protein [Alphaproteobacteria bacterium]|nr:Smr/MutS family protein [Alphaproteobacteria bacterium]